MYGITVSSYMDNLTDRKPSSAARDCGPGRNTRRERLIQVFGAKGGDLNPHGFTRQILSSPPT